MHWSDQFSIIGMSKECTRDAQKHPDLSTWWRACARPDWMFELLRRTERQNVDKSALAKCVAACLQRVMPEIATHDSLTMVLEAINDGATWETIKAYAGDLHRYAAQDVNKRESACEERFISNMIFSVAHAAGTLQDPIAAEHAIYSAASALHARASDDFYAAGKVRVEALRIMADVVRAAYPYPPAKLQLTRI